MVFYILLKTLCLIQLNILSFVLPYVCGMYIIMYNYFWRAGIGLILSLCLLIRVSYFGCYELYVVLYFTLSVRLILYLLYQYLYVYYY